MAKFPNPTSASNLIDRLKPNNAPKRTWFAVLSQPLNSAHVFKVLDIKLHSGKTRYLEAICVESSNKKNIGTHLQVDRNAAMIRRAYAAALLKADIAVGGKFILVYTPNAQNVVVANLYSTF